MNASIKIPTHLSEITLDQYQRFLKVESESDDNYFIECKMIEIFCNVEYEDVSENAPADIDIGDDKGIMLGDIQTADGSKFFASIRTFSSKCS